jgi:ketosteroid isomerase-like protein
MNQQTETLVRECNEAWQAQDWDTLARCYHPTAILVPPDAGEPIISREDIVSTYREFMEVAIIDDFQITELDSYDFPSTHLVHMHFTVEYQLEGQTLKDIGLEVYAIDLAETAVIVWRSQSITDQLVLAS